MTIASLSEQRRDTLHRRVRWIVAATIGYNAIEATVAIEANLLVQSCSQGGRGGQVRMHSVFDL